MKQFSDEWLVPALAALVSEAAIADLRSKLVEDNTSLWQLVLDRRLAAEEAVLASVAARFRMPIADLSQVDSRISEEVPEQLVRRFNVVPLRCTDSRLDVATANPFDMDAEKMLAFATGREVRLSLCSPSRIRKNSTRSIVPTTWSSSCSAGSPRISRSLNFPMSLRTWPPAPRKPELGRSSSWSTPCWPTGSPAGGATFTSSRPTRA